MDGVFEAAKEVEGLLKEVNSGAFEVNSRSILGEIEPSYDKLVQAVDSQLMDLKKLGPAASMNTPEYTSNTPEYTKNIDEVLTQLEQLKVLLEDDDPAAKELIDEIGEIAGYQDQFKEKY